MIKVKICGITNLQDARHAAERGADAIGFNFYSGSKRYISPTDAAVIVAQISAGVQKIGVFVNAPIEEIVEIEHAVQLDTVQLHGDETAEFIEELRLESDASIIKAVRIGPDFDAYDALQYKADAILLDAFSIDERGGTGETFDWAIARQIVEVVDRVYLAGGLSPDNVADAIRAVKPFAVDACSLLEASPGFKDREKVAAFIKAAKEAI